MKSKQDENNNLSAYEKAGSGEVDPRCIPQRLTGPVPEHDDIMYPDYPESDQKTWKFTNRISLDCCKEKCFLQPIIYAVKMN